VTDLTLRFLLVLNEKGRLGHLETISDAYDQLVHAAFGRVEVDVFTAAPLGAGQLDSIRSRIGAILGKEPVLYTYADPAMIGGLKLRIGDQLIDGSVASRLRRIKHSLLASGGHDGAARPDDIARFIEEGDEA
jgi:F-type H+-transporting ATPase subunit delta